MLAGELTLIAGGKQTVLKANDACFIGPNESREIVNRGNDVVTMLVAVSTPHHLTWLGMRPPGRAAASAHAPRPIG